jgi:biopolymer transport protein ExbD
MKSRKSIGESEELKEINISPLIDMVFILLIFFIVTTVFVEEPGVEVQKPKAASIMDLEKNSILIAITATGEIVFGGGQIGIGGIRPTVRRLCAQEKLPVILQVDENAPGALVVRAIDEAKLGKARQVYISANPI